jgi:hypothetical protein
LLLEPPKIMGRVHEKINKLNDFLQRSSNYYLSIVILLYNSVQSTQNIEHK